MVCMSLYTKDIGYRHSKPPYVQFHSALDTCSVGTEYSSCHQCIPHCFLNRRCHNPPASFSSQPILTISFFHGRLVTRSSKIRRFLSRQPVHLYVIFVVEQILKLSGQT